MGEKRLIRVHLGCQAVSLGAARLDVIDARHSRSALDLFAFRALRAMCALCALCALLGG